MYCVVAIVHCYRVLLAAVVKLSVPPRFEVYSCTAFSKRVYSLLLAICISMHHFDQTVCMTNSFSSKKEHVYCSKLVDRLFRMKR